MTEKRTFALADLAPIMLARSASRPFPPRLWRERGRLAVSTTEQEQGENGVVSLVMPLTLRRELEAKAADNERTLSAEARVALRAHVAAGKDGR